MAAAASIDDGGDENGKEGGATGRERVGRAERIHKLEEGSVNIGIHNEQQPAFALPRIDVSLAGGLVYSIHDDASHGPALSLSCHSLALLSRRVPCTLVESAA